MELNSYTGNEFIIGLAGFVNMGYTCYLNSILQIFSNIPPLREYFASKEYYMSLIDNIKNNNCEINNSDDIKYISKQFTSTLSYELERLMKAIWKKNCTEIISYKPSSFRRMIAKKFPSFNNNGQQDAHECLLAMFDIIGTELGQKFEINPLLSNNELKTFEVLDNEYDSIEKEIDFNVKQIKIANIRVLEDHYPGLIKRYKQLINLKSRFNSSYSIFDKLFLIGVCSTCTCKNCEYKSYNYVGELCLSSEIPSWQPTDEQISEKMKTILFPFELGITNNQNDKHHKGIFLKKTFEKTMLDDLNENDSTETPKITSIFDDSIFTPQDKNQENNDSISITTDCIIEGGSVSSSTSTSDIDGFDMFLEEDDSDNNLKLSNSNITMNNQNIINKPNVSMIQLENIRRTKALSELQEEHEFSLESCLDLYFKSEEIDRRCEFCNVMGENIKSLTLLNVPEYLIIQLKRFEFDWLKEQGYKKSQFINFTEELDISKYVDNDILDHLKTSNKYQLINVVNHIGVYGSGHYYAYCKNSINNKWYCFNDENINEINNVVSPHAYLLVYQKI
jgi:ubiquitin C-terminal hydrolase